MSIISKAMGKCIQNMRVQIALIRVVTRPTARESKQYVVCGYRPIPEYIGTYVLVVIGGSTSESRCILVLLLLLQVYTIAEWTSHFYPFIRFNWPSQSIERRHRSVQWCHGSLKTPTGPVFYSYFCGKGMHLQQRY